MSLHIDPAALPRLKQLWAAGVAAVECGTEIGLSGESHDIREAVLRAIEQMERPAPKPPKVQDDDGWTDARIATLKKLHVDGASAGEIAHELGGVSRSAVLGKLRRLGLADRGSGRASSHSNLPASYRTSRRDDAMFAVDGVDGKPAPADLEIPVEQRRSLLGPPFGAYPERGPNECGWPIGDVKEPGFFFCGAPSYAGRHYCAHHCRRASNGLGNRRAA